MVDGEYKSFCSPTYGPSAGTALPLQDGELPFIPTGDHRKMSLHPPVECGLSTSYYSGTGIALTIPHDGEDKDSPDYAHPVSDTGLAALHGEEASPTTLDPGILDDGEFHHHHHDAEEDPLVALAFDWGSLMELPDDSTVKSPLDNTQEEEEVVLFYSNWSLPKNPHGEPSHHWSLPENPHGESPCCPPDEELTGCEELTPTEVKILTTLAEAGVLKTCTKDRMLLTPEDKVPSPPPADGTTLSADNMPFALAPEDGMLLHMNRPKDGELTLAHGEPHDHEDGELPLVLLLYDTKLEKVLGELGTLGLPEMDGGCNYPPPKAMQCPLPAPEPPPLLC
jgi:hypothetical protein